MPPAQKSRDVLSFLQSLGCDLTREAEILGMKQIQTSTLLATVSSNLFHKISRISRASTFSIYTAFSLPRGIWPALLINDDVELIHAESVIDGLWNDPW